jgi:hypothetical protein
MVVRGIKTPGLVPIPLTFILETAVGMNREPREPSERGFDANFTN